MSFFPQNTILNGIFPLKLFPNSQRKLVLVYSMGKVGSQSVYYSLKEKLPFADVYQVHFLTDNALGNVLPNSHGHFHNNIDWGLKVAADVKAHRGSRIKVITLVREPVGRAISNLMQNWPALFDDIETVPDSTLKDHIENNNHRYTLEWFDAELKAFTGFNVYQHPFNPHKGYAVYRHGRFEILVLKFEMLNQVAQEAIGKFLGLKLDLIKTNTSESKRGSEKFHFLHSNVQVERGLLNSVYAHRYMTHFYSPSEIEQFKNRWGKQE